MFLVFHIRWNGTDHDFTMGDGHVHRDLLVRQAASATARGVVALEEIEGGGCDRKTVYVSKLPSSGPMVGFHIIVSTTSCQVVGK